MYAVFADGAIHYLGSDRDAAMAVMDTDKVLHAKFGSTLTTINTLAELQTTFESHLNTEKSSKPQSALDDLLKRLEEIDPEEIMKVTKENSEKAIGQVRSMGLRGLKGLGEGFTALGDLLQKAGEDEPATEKRTDE